MASYAYSSVVLILIFLKVPSVNALLKVTDTVFIATGENLGLSVQVDFTGENFLTCIVDGEDQGEIIAVNITSSSAFEAEFTASGRYTIVLSCFADTEFNTSYVDDFYIGNAITEINASIGLSGLVIPFGFPLATDPPYEVSFSTGTDVDVEFELPHMGWNHVLTNLENGTHNITIPAINFPAPGLYTLSVNFTNPLEPSGITKYAVLALQEPVQVTNVVLKQYATSDNIPTYIMANEQLEVEISLSGGDNLTASLTILDTDENITALVGTVCTGKTTLQSLVYTFNETGEYNITVDVSNYVSNYALVIPVVVIYQVNSFTFTVAPLTALYSEPVRFTVNIGATALLPMGDVTCYFDYDDGTVETKLFDQAVFDNGLFFYEHLYTARWYATNITCSNQLPSIVNSQTTIQDIYTLVKIANPVENLILTHDSETASHHPFSVPILFTVQLTNPGTDLPLANLTCNFTFANNEGTELNEMVEGDVTDVSTITLSKTLPAAFTYQVSALCYNVNSSGIFKTADTFKIYYDCWKTETYFSNSFKDPSYPLLAKTNEDMKISASVFLSNLCNGTVFHYWSVYQSDGVTDAFVENITSLSAGVLNLAKHKMQPGLFKIVLTTYFTGYSPFPTLSDYVYVKYTLPALIISVKVDGADTDMKEVWRQKDTPVDSSASYDPAEISGTLTRQWECRKGTLIESDVVSFLGNENFESWPTDANENCDDIFTQAGAESFVITENSMSQGQWYLFMLTLNHIETNRTAKKAQALFPIDQEPLELQFVCQSNCHAGSGNMAVLALFDLELNIQVVTPGVQNDTLGYKWTLKQYDTSTQAYVDKSGELDKATSTGFVFSKTKMEVLGGSKYMVSCTVTATNFAPTTKSQLYRMNMAPYNGTCILTEEKDTVVASIDELQFSCSGWKDEGGNSERSDQDNGGNLKYCLVQVFLTETLEVNTSIPANVHECRVDPVQTFKLLKSPDDRVNTTLVQIRITDHIGPPYTVFNIGYFEIKPAVADDASGDAGAEDVEKVFQSNNDLLESGAKTNSVDSIGKAALVIVDALPKNIPEPPVYEPEEDETGGGMITGFNEDGELLSAGDALDSLGKKEEDPTKTKCKEVTNVIATYVLNTTKNQNAEIKSDVTIQSVVVRAVTGLGYQAKNLGSDTMDMMSNIIEDVFNSTNKSEGGNPEHDSFLTDCLVMMGSVDSAFSPSTLKDTFEDVDIEAVRKRSQFESVFASGETILKVEEGRLSLSEMEFIKQKIAFKNLKKMEERKSLCNNYSRNKSNYQKGIIKSVKLSDGNQKSIGGEDTKIALTRDTSDKLANTTLKSLKSSVKVPNLKGIGKASIAMLESKTTTHLGAKAGAVTSGEGTLLIDTEQELDGKIKITQEVENTTYERLELVTDKEDANGFMYFMTYVKHKSDDLYFSIKPDSDSYSDVEKFAVYILYMESPDSLETEYVSKVKFTAKGEIKSPDWTIKFPPSERGEHEGIYKIGIEMIEKATASETRRKREATNSNGTYFNFATATMACMTWDDSTDSWRTDECDGTWNPDTAELECDCKPKKELTFANSFYVAPNKIDFSSVFLKFSPLNQAAVMATLLLIFLIYIIIVIWARRQDRKDLLKWGITPFSDNFSEDNYFYVIKVFTGLRPGAGTKSRICMVIAGEEMDSGVREVADGVREEFSTGSVMNFLMSTTVYLGDLEYVRIWHDNSGSGNFASWYLSKIEVHDVQRNESFTFLGERWLAVEKDDGLLECVLPVCKTENLNIFKNRFFLNAKENLADSHIWISVAYRPQASNFTRTQRASCALLFVMLTMISNAMFFKGSNEDNYETPAELQVGPFRFSLQQIYISFVCALIVTPATLIVIYLFKLSKIKVDPDETLYKPNSRASRYKIPFMNDWLEREQKRSMELERHLVQKGIPNSQSFPLPHWCARIAWFIIVVTTFLCSFFIMLYSMEWGKQKSEEWITTFLMSFFESIFCLDPVKVGVMALMFALIFRSTKESEAPVNRSTIMKKYSTTLRRSGGLRLPAPPLDEKKLEKARTERRRDLLMKRAVRDIIVNIIIIWILFSISFSNRDVKSYYMHQEVIDRILQPVNMPSFSSIRTTSDFFDWLNTTAIINLFPEYEKDGNNTPLHWRERQFIEGGALFRVGPPRLRQLRTPRKSCKNAPFPTEDCFKKYQEPSEETGSYCIGWIDGVCDPDEEMYMYSSNAWRFTSAFDIWGLPIAGYYTTYGGGGYIAELSVNRQVSQYIFEELFQNSWVDRQTRAVLLEFTLYCLNANIFTYNMFMVEFPETGGAFPYYVIFPMRVYLHQGPLGIYTLACEVLFVLYIIICTVMVIIQMVQQKKAFFKEGWQVYELIFIILSYVAIVMNIIQVVFTNLSLDTFRNDKKGFVNFYHLAIWNTVLVLLIGVLVFMATLRTLNILGYNKRINAVAKVFTKAASDLVWFGIFFSYVFTCYAAFGFLLFGWKLKSYKNVFTTMGTLFISMIGKSRFTEIEETDPIFSKIYFMCFIFFVVYMILTMFLAVLSKAIDQVHAETKTDKGDEMVDYVLKKIKGLMSYGGKTKKGAVKPAPWNRKANEWGHKRRAFAFNKATNREILQEIRESMQQALTGNPRDFSTPVADHNRRHVTFRR